MLEVAHVLVDPCSSQAQSLDGRHVHCRVGITRPHFDLLPTGELASTRPHPRDGSRHEATWDARQLGLGWDARPQSALSGRELLNGRIMRKVIAPLLGTVALAFVAGATPTSGAAQGTRPAPTVTAPLSQAVVIHDWFSKPGARQAGVSALIARLRAAAARGAA